MKQDINLAFDFKSTSQETMLKTVSAFGWMIEYMDDPSEELQLAAVRRDMNAIDCIKNPTDKVKRLHEVLWIL